MHLTDKLSSFAIESPEVVKKIVIILTALFAVLLFRVWVDTDPDNMLSQDEFASSFHAATKLQFNLNEVVILGIVNEDNPNGVFNPETLKKIHQLSTFAAQLVDEQNPLRYVVAADILAPHNVNIISNSGHRTVDFKRLMETPPTSDEEALKIREMAMTDPHLKGTMVSENGKAMALSIPVSQQSYAKDVSEKLQEKISTLSKGSDHFYLTGIPVAKEVLGQKILGQTALLMLLVIVLIFLLLLFFFKNFDLTLAPIIVSLITVTCTMGLFIGTGNSLHVIGSMIPIFLIPITVLGSVHILSEFYDDYQKMLDRHRTITHVMSKVALPLFHTALISATGFGSLAFSPFLPLRVFGIFMAIGILLAWIFTVLFIPAHIMTLREEKFIDFGNKDLVSPEDAKSFLHRHLRWSGNLISTSPGLVLGFNIILLSICLLSIDHVQPDTNQVTWFKQSHSIPMADKALNKHLPGINEAYLILEGSEQETSLRKASAWLSWKLEKKLRDDEKVRQIAFSQLDEVIAVSENEDQLHQELLRLWEQEHEQGKDEAEKKSWARALDALDGMNHREQLFKRSDMIQYTSNLQDYLLEQGSVGKSYSLANLIKTLNLELNNGNPKYFTIPPSFPGVTRTLDFFLESNKAGDLFHLVTPDYKIANVRLQLVGTSSSDLDRVKKDVNRFLKENPPPEELKASWAGLTNVNAVWQDKISAGMLKSFIIAMIASYVMMLILFRSLLWGLLAIIPFTFTTFVSYGIMGLMGKDYTLPLAILAALSLAPAVDFGVHFLMRIRTSMKSHSNWPKTMRELFEEPATAISRNGVILGLGFSPLLFAALIPHQITGFLMAIIMVTSSLTTLWVLPALLTLIQRMAFHDS